MPAFCSVEDGRLMEPVASFDGRPAINQHSHRLKVASPSGVHQSCSSVAVHRVNLRALFYQERNAMASLGLEGSSCGRYGLEQRGQPIRAPAIHVCTLSNRRFHQVQLPLVNCGNKVLVRLSQRRARHQSLLVLAAARARDCEHHQAGSKPNARLASSQAQGTYTFHPVIPAETEAPCKSKTLRAGPVTKSPSCHRAGVLARLNGLQSYAKGQVFDVPRPKAGEDACMPPTLSLPVTLRANRFPPRPKRQFQLMQARVLGMTRA